MLEMRKINALRAIGGECLPDGRTVIRSRGINNLKVQFRSCSQVYDHKLAGGPASNDLRFRFMDSPAGKHSLYAPRMGFNLQKNILVINRIHFKRLTGLESVLGGISLA